MKFLLSFLFAILFTSCGQVINITCYDCTDAIKDINPPTKADKIRAKYYKINYNKVHIDDATKSHKEIKDYLKTRLN